MKEGSLGAGFDGHEERRTEKVDWDDKGIGNLLQVLK